MKLGKIVCMLIVLAMVGGVLWAHAGNSPSGQGASFAQVGTNSLENRVFMDAGLVFDILGLSFAGDQAVLVFFTISALLAFFGVAVLRVLEAFGVLASEDFIRIRVKGLLPLPAGVSGLVKAA